MESDEILREALKVLGKSESSAQSSINPSVAGDVVADATGSGGGNVTGGDTSVQMTVTGALGTTDGKLDESLSRLTSGVEQLRITSEAQIREIGANTSAVSQNTSAQGSKGLSTAGGVLSSIFSPILRYSPLSPIISGIASLFGGGKAEPAPLTQYVAPAAIHYQAYLSNAAEPSTGAATPSPTTKESVAATPIQINVQTIDSRSFLDHSDAIASAVRDALLRSHPLGDVLKEG